MLNPFLGSAKVKDVYIVWYPRIFNVVDKICFKAISTVFCCLLDTTFHAFLLFHSIVEIREALFKTSFRFCYTPRKKAGGRGGGGEHILESPCPCVRLFSCICLPGFVQKISSEQLSLLYPNLVWWCIVLSRCIMQKNGDAIFKFKVTIRDFIITIWQFQLYLLNWCFFCNRT